MNKFLILSFALFAGTTLQAQNYLIRHDFLNQESRYYKIGKGDTLALKKASIKGKGNLTLLIENYNPFYWKSSVEKIPLVDEMGENMAKLFNPLMILKQLGGSAMDKFLPVVLSGNTRGARKIGNSFNKYKANYNELVNMQAVLNKLSLAREKLTELKYDVKHTESFIKTEAANVLSSVANYSASELDSARIRARALDNRYAWLIYSLDTLSKSLHTNFKEEEAQFDESEKEAWQNIVGEVDKFYQPKINSLQQGSNNSGLFSAETDQIINLYREIRETEFKYSFNTSGTSDINQLKIVSYPIEATAKADTVVRFIPVRKKGGLRLTNSFGISFIAMNDKRYFIGSDSIISSKRGNLFAPSLTSFVHFYGGKASGIKWGGNIGVGIPITENDKSVSFLTGLSLIFGKHDEVLICFGVAGSRVEQLDGGWKLGDKVSNPNNFKLPTDSYYKLGGFVGFTFNLSSLAKK